MQRTGLTAAKSSKSDKAQKSKAAQFSKLEQPLDIIPEQSLLESSVLYDLREELTAQRATKDKFNPQIDFTKLQALKYDSPLPWSKSQMVDGHKPKLTPKEIKQNLIKAGKHKSKIRSVEKHHRRMVSSLGHILDDLDKMKDQVKSFPTKQEIDPLKG